MNSLIRTGFRACKSRLVPNRRCDVTTMKKGYAITPTHTRTLWHMCNAKTDKLLEPQLTTQICQCGNSGLVQTDGEKQLVDFLAQEIFNENRAKKAKPVPKELDGFQIITNGSDVKLSKENQLETITVQFNVSLSVDAESEPDFNIQADEPNVGEVKSRPAFNVNITRNGKTLSFNCSFLSKLDSDENDDSFEICEVTFYEGEWNEKTYSVAGEVLDGQFYDLLMTILEEKGISNEFANKICDVATSHEQHKYVGFLKDLKQFASAN